MHAYSVLKIYSSGIRGAQVAAGHFVPLVKKGIEGEF